MARSTTHLKRFQFKKGHGNAHKRGAMPMPPKQRPKAKSAADAIGYMTAPPPNAAAQDDTGAPTPDNEGAEVTPDQELGE